MPVLWVAASGIAGKGRRNLVWHRGSSGPALNTYRPRLQERAFVSGAGIYWLWLCDVGRHHERLRRDGFDLVFEEIARALSPSAPACSDGSTILSCPITSHHVASRRTCACELCMKCEAG